MKILFVTARKDPKDPDSGAGVNFNAHSTLKRWAQDIKIAGPFEVKPTLVERGITRLASVFTEKRLIKFYPSYIRHSNRVVKKMMADFQPDIIFSKASIPLVNVRLTAPLVYTCDSSVKWVKKEWPHFSKLGFWIMEQWERQVINKASHIITFSQTNADILKSKYHIRPEQITVHPIPSVIPQAFCSFEEKSLRSAESLNLLLVGKTYQGKGVDIAIQSTQILNDNGIPATLRIVGQHGSDTSTVHFFGLFSKKGADKLSHYIENYRWAHFLIFPSRFDAAGIVPSEAAGFGVPTITNAAGGLATTVEDKVSGIVLEKHSPASAYAEVLQYFWDNPDEYQTLRESTYKRYQSVLNWDVLGKRIFEIMQSIIKSQKH